MSDWHPIETAPSDGSMFLAFNSAHGDMAVIGRTTIDNGMWRWTDVGGANRGIQNMWFDGYFQFWQPLPAPPANSL